MVEQCLRKTNQENLAALQELPGGVNTTPLNSFQENNWENTRRVFLILAKTWFLFHEVGKETITFLSLWNRGMSLETFRSHF